MKDYEPVPDHVSNDFRTLMGLTLSQPLPSKLERNYWDLRKMKDISGAGDITVPELAMLVIVSKNKEIDERVPVVGDKVNTMLQGKPATGVMVGDDGGTFVQVDVDDDEMKFREVLRKDTFYRADDFEREGQSNAE